jgi:hypothetical protein
MGADELDAALGLGGLRPEARELAGRLGLRLAGHCPGVPGGVVVAEEADGGSDLETGPLGYRCRAP